MKREFLQNLKVGQTPLPKDVIDAIMEENGRDIEAAKAPFGDYKALRERLAQAETAARDAQTQAQALEAARQAAQDWEAKYNAAEARYQAELSQAAFDHALETAITAAGGRSVKAISALLDVEAIRAGDDPASGIRDALAALKRDSGYLFDQPAPPPYAAGTGTVSPQRYTMEELARMPMDEYARWRASEQD